MFKVNNRNTRTRCEICSKLTIKIIKATIKHYFAIVTIQLWNKKITALAVEIFKTLNQANPPYMKNVFTSKKNPKVKHSNIMVKFINPSRFGTQSLRSFGRKIRNSLPDQRTDAMYL